MKILCTGPELIIPGGVTSYLRTLQPHLGDMLDYFIVGARGQQEGLLNKIYRMFKDYWGFSRTLCRRDYDLIHLNPSFGTKALLRDGIFLLISKMLRKKVVIFIHGWDESCEYRIRKRWLWLFRCVYFHANAFIVLAEEFKSKLRSFGYMKPIYRGTTCVDDAVFTVFTEKSYDLYKPDAPFNVLFLSRLEKEKGVFETIEAFAIIKDKYPYITLTIAGDGDALESARDFTVQRGLEEISFSGYLTGDAKSDAFLNASCYILPTYSEGIPISVLEAMAYGLPVVTRPVGGMKDFLEDGKMGYIVESLDPSAFAEAVEKLIQEPETCRRMGRYNREFALKHFVASRVAERIKRIYHEVDQLER